MTFEYDLDLAERNRLAQEDGLYPDDNDTRKPVHFGRGKLCSCGLKCANDCDCPFKH